MHTLQFLVDADRVEGFLFLITEDEIFNSTNETMTNKEKVCHENISRWTLFWYVKNLNGSQSMLLFVKIFSREATT